VISAVLNTWCAVFWHVYGKVAASSDTVCW